MPELTTSRWTSRILQRRFRRELAPDPRHSALVFAPHQDDETLGCGGTIALKRAVETAVTIAFMTDGCRSHSRFMDGGELARLRRDEAIAACRILGVGSEHTHFFDLPDGDMQHFPSEARQHVDHLLRATRPDEVFVPYRHDGPPDHEATFQAVHAALAGYDEPVRIFEYPIWFLNQWPWVPQDPRNPRGLRSAITGLLRSGRALRALMSFRAGVSLASVLETKRAALAAHHTQMERRRDTPGWPVLSDVREGRFLDCFFREFEMFRCTHNFNAGHARVPGTPGAPELTRQG